MNRKNFYTVISCVLAVCFTVYAALDTFVIPKAYASVETAVSRTENTETDTDVETVPDEITDETGDASDEEACDETSDTPGTVTVTDDSYSDDNISITITQYRENDTDIYVADIRLSSADYLKTALAKATYGKNITARTSDIAEDVDAILAINGDYYGVQESGYVIRNGVLYRSTARSDQEDLVIYGDGSFELINEKEVTAEELINKGAVNVLCFGPGLLEDGSISVSKTDEVAKAMTSNPRTAIGIIDELHYVFVVADGRTSASEGLSLYELAEFMQSIGVTDAYNLDGGGSSTMVFNGTVINNPASGSSKHKSGSSSSERSVSDIVYIGY